MNRSLYTKLVLIILFLIIALTAVTGVFLTRGVRSYYLNEFYARMQEVFADEERASGLRSAAAADDPDNMAEVVENLYTGLNQADPDHQEQYQNNAQAAAAQLQDFAGSARTALAAALEENGVELSGLVTFHDGFRYFAQFLDVPLLASIEEEEGSEASAKEINEITALVKEYNLPVIFTEVNGSDATAQAIARETGCAVYPLDLIMSGEGSGIQPYVDAMDQNIDTILEALG